MDIQRLILLCLLVLAIGAALYVYRSRRSCPHGPAIFSFLGAPGSGKGTLATQAVEKLGFTQLSTGDLCRSHTAAQTDLGKQLEAYTNSGKLVPDTIIASMVDEWLKAHSTTCKTIILDGFPRTAAQAKLLQDMLATKFPAAKLRIIELGASTEELVRRLSNRLVCSNKSCAAVYSASQYTGDEHPVCTKCKSPLMKRADDSEEVIRNRLKVYHETRDALVNFYKQAHLPIETIETENKSPEIIFEEFKKILH